jgi:hypothetical protein
MLGGHRRPGADEAAAEEVWPGPWTSRPQSIRSSSGSDGGTATSRIGIRPAARCRTPGGISATPLSPTAIRSPPDFTPPQPIAIAAIMTQLLAVEVGRRPQKGGV